MSVPTSLNEALLPDDNHCHDDQDHCEDDHDHCHDDHDDCEDNDMSMTKNVSNR